MRRHPRRSRAFRRTPGVVGVGAIRQLTIVFSKSRDVFVPNSFVPTAGPIDGSFGHEVDRPRIVEGRIARGADELNIGEQLADVLHVHVGDVIHLDSFTPAQVRGEITGETRPEGPPVTFRIVGIVRRPLDLGGRGTTGGVVAPTRAFVEKYGDRIGSFTGTILRVRTRHGQADVPRRGRTRRARSGGTAISSARRRCRSRARAPSTRSTSSPSDCGSSRGLPGRPVSSRSVSRWRASSLLPRSTTTRSERSARPGASGGPPPR